MKNLTAKQLAKHFVSANYNNTPAGRFVFEVKYRNKVIKVYSNEAYYWDGVRSALYNASHNETSGYGECQGAMHCYLDAVELYYEEMANK